MTDTSSTFDKSAQTPKSWGNDVQLALIFLTRVPWKLNEEVAPQALNRALRAFPIIGLLVGGFAATVFGLATLLNLPSLVCSLLAVLATILITGALHEDGLADVADGFGGGHTVERKLEIMRDSRVGSYGVLAMVIGVGLRVAALDGFSNWGLASAAIVGAACLSRLAPALLIYCMSPARNNGLAATMDKPDLTIILQATALACGFFLLCTSFTAGFLALGICGLTLYSFGLIAKSQVNGHTGDVCGASQQIIEITALLTLVAMT